MKPAREDWSLALFTDVLHLRSLHWGLWEPGDASDLAHLRRAQVRFTERLTTFVPVEATSILDVGCGVGDVAQTLSRLGHEVMCISPDPAHARAFAGIDDPRIRFRQCRFEEYEPDRSFDLVLFCESCDYFAPDDLFARAGAALAPGGHVLAASMFRKRHTPGYWHHVFEDWVASGRRQGFAVLRSEDVTDRALPTMELLHGIAVQYAAPAIRLALRTFRGDRSLRGRLVRLLLRERLAALEPELVEPAIERLDPERFAAEALYAFVLLRRAVPPCS